jgi:hypothetical protein
MFRVHRDDLGSGATPGGLYNRPSGDERLFVGQGEAASGPQGSEGDWQAGETDHAVDDHIGACGDLGQGFRPGEKLNPSGQLGPQLARPRRVANRHPLGSQFRSLIGQDLYRGPGPDCHHPIRTGFRPDDVDGLGTDRPCGTNQADRLQRFRREGA